MVVDDDYENQVMAQNIFGNQFQIASIEKGTMVNKFIPRVNPDLILLDVNMPDMNGFEVFEHMKQAFGENHPPVIFLTADRQKETEVACFKAGAIDYIGKPFEPDIMRNRIMRALELEELRKNLAHKVEEQTKEITEQSQKMLKLQGKLIDGMATLIESRDGNTGEHVINTRKYVSMIVNKMYEKEMYPDIINQQYIKYICEVAPLHDVGKIAVSDIILNKPGRFTPEEFEQMKKHASEGGKIIEKLLGEDADPTLLKIAKEIAQFHHEKWNGKGYPSGLSGEEIPLAARIMAVADVFDALISKRAYKEAMPVKEAFTIIREEAGTHFDPEIAHVFLELQREVEQSL